MKKCKYCQSNIDEKAKLCPYCRKRQSNPHLIVIAIVITIMAFAGLYFFIKKVVNDLDDLQRGRRSIGYIYNINK